MVHKLGTLSVLLSPSFTFFHCRTRWAKTPHTSTPTSPKQPPRRDILPLTLSFWVAIFMCVTTEHSKQEPRHELTIRHHLQWGSLGHSCTSKTPDSICQLKIWMRKQALLLRACPLKCTIKGESVFSQSASLPDVPYFPKNWLKTLSRLVCIPSQCILKHST